MSGSFFVLFLPEWIAHFYIRVKDNIQSFLSSRDNYFSGVDLYEQIFGQDAFWKLFKKSKNAYTERELRKRLSDYLEKSAFSEPVKTVQKTAKKKHVAKTKPTERYVPSDYQKLPHSLRSLADQLQDLWPRLNARRHSLIHLSSDKERLEVAGEIQLELVPKIDQIYHQLDYWKMHGKLLEDPEKSPAWTSPVAQLKAWQRELQTAREYISRNKDSEDPIKQERVTEKEARKEELIKLIKKHT